MFLIVCHQETISFFSWSSPLCKTILSWYTCCWQWRQLSKPLTGVFNRLTYNVTAKSVPWLNWAKSKFCVRMPNMQMHAIQNPKKKAKTEIVHFKSRKQNARFFCWTMLRDCRFHKLHNIKYSLFQCPNHNHHVHGTTINISVSTPKSVQKEKREKRRFANEL